VWDTRKPIFLLDTESEKEAVLLDPGDLHRDKLCRRIPGLRLLASSIDGP